MRDLYENLRSTPSPAQPGTSRRRRAGRPTPPGCRQRIAERVDRRRHDIAIYPAGVEVADVVVLHRVVCCYPDYKRLLTAAADHARRLLVFSYPPRSAGPLLIHVFQNLAFRLLRREFRVFTHPPKPCARWRTRPSSHLCTSRPRLADLRTRALREAAGAGLPEIGYARQLAWHRTAAERLPGSAPVWKELMMFVQVIRGQVPDAARMRAALDRWATELAPGATGWLGSTAGITEDGRFITLARFESEAAARRNSARPEQDQWWAETSGLFTGEATFRDSNDVTVDLTGDPDKAGFVQIIQGRGSDPDRARELMSQDSDEWAKFRPDVVGSIAVGHEGGDYTMAMYFTSEAEAREGERKEPPAHLKAQMDEMNKLNIGVPEFLDLKDPWLYTPE